MRCTRGFTIVNLLCALVVMGWLLSLGVEGWNAWRERTLMLRARQLAVQTFHELRLEACRRQSSCRLVVREGAVAVERQEGAAWKGERVLDFPVGVGVSLVGTPVFHPSGWVAPAGSFRLQGRSSRWGVWISANGRVRQESLAP